MSTRAAFSVACAIIYRTRRESVFYRDNNCQLETYALS